MTKYYDEYIRLANINPQMKDSIKKIKKNNIQMDKFWKYCIKCRSEDKKEWKKTLDKAIKFPDEWVRFCTASNCLEIKYKTIRAIVVLMKLKKSENLDVSIYSDEELIMFFDKFNPWSIALKLTKKIINKIRRN